MADEQKSPPKADKGGETPKPVSKAEASPAGSPPSGTPGTPAGLPPEPAKPAAAATAKPAAAPAKPAAAPAPKAPVKPDPWTSPLLDAVQKAFPGAIQEAVVFRKMPSITVAKESLLALCHFLRSEDGGAYTLLTDETAVDYPKRE